jgi:Bacteriophage tail tube protein
MTIPAILRNFNLFIDGIGYAGVVDEITLPKLAIKTEEYRGGGMDAPVDIDVGMEKLDCEFTLSEYNAYVMTYFGFDDHSDAPLRLRFKGALAKPDLSAASAKPLVVPVDILIHGNLREMEMGTWKAGDKASLKLSVNAHYYQLSFDAKELINIDIINMERKVVDDISIVGLLS